MDVHIMLKRIMESSVIFNLIIQRTTVFVRNLVSHTEGGTKTEGVRD
jgi:hypothetical protein